MSLQLQLSDIRNPLETVQEGKINLAIAQSRGYIKGTLTVGQVFKNLSYSFETTKKNTISDFLKCHLGFSRMEPVDQESGRSSHRGFWIVDKATKEKRYFLKTFLRDDKAYIEMIFGLDFLSRVEGVSPRIRLLGKCEVADTETFLLIEDVVKGKSIQELYWRVSEHLLGTHGRLEEFNTLCTAVQACGSLLAKLHTYTTGRTIQLRIALPEYAKMQAEFEKVADQLQKCPQEGIYIEKLEYSVDCAIEKMNQARHLIGVTHGDLKLSHIIYNKDTGVASLIDPQTLQLSLDRNVEPVALPSLEFCRYLRLLQLSRISYRLHTGNTVSKRELLTPEEVDVLVQHLKSGYILGGGTLPTKVEEDFALLLHNLQVIANAGRELPEPDSSRFQDLVSICQNDLRDRFVRESNEYEMWQNRW